MAEDDSYIKLTALDATRANGMYHQREHQGHNKHLNACKLRLKRFITEHPEQTFLVYQVPMVVVGSALREAKSVLNHMIHSLRGDGFAAEYLGSNLIFISWKAAVANPEHEVQDYVRHAQLGFPSERRARRRNDAPVVVPLTQENLQRSGPGAPVAVSDTERTRARMDREIRKRLQAYDAQSSTSAARRRAVYDRTTSHQDALRKVVNRTVL